MLNGLSAFRQIIVYTCSIIVWGWRGGGLNGELLKCGGLGDLGSDCQPLTSSMSVCCPRQTVANIVLFISIHGTFTGMLRAKYPSEPVKLPSSLQDDEMQVII